MGAAKRHNAFILVMGVAGCLILAPSTRLKAEEIRAAQASQEHEATEYGSEGLRDPFQEEKIEVEEAPKEVTETRPLPALQVQGIVWGGSLPQAIINNIVVKIGDTMDGARITDINKNGVTVFFGNRQFNLTVVPAETPEKNKTGP